MLNPASQGRRRRVSHCCCARTKRTTVRAPLSGLTIYDTINKKKERRIPWEIPCHTYYSVSQTPPYPYLPTRPDIPRI
jgi:hypothetical protein